MELTGTLDERIAAAADFAREHGGFEHCRLFPYDSGAGAIDLSKVIDDEKKLDRSTLSERMNKYITSGFSGE